MRLFSSSDHFACKPSTIFDPVVKTEEKNDRKRFIYQNFNTICSQLREITIINWNQTNFLALCHLYFTSRSASLRSASRLARGCAPGPIPPCSVLSLECEKTLNLIYYFTSVSQHLCPYYTSFVSLSHRLTTLLRIFFFFFLIFLTLFRSDYNEILLYEFSAL